MPHLVTHTAFLVPHRRADILTRMRLIELLTQLARKKLVLVIAPAGYGKTTLLIDYAHTSVLPCCWYSIDQGDNDTIRFLENFITAIERCYPGFGDISIAFIQDLGAPEINLDRVITILVNEIYEKIKVEFYIILDHLQSIDENPDIQYFLQRFIQKVSENCHLIIATRRDPFASDFDLQIAHTQIGYLMLDDLAFTLDEIQQLVRQNDNYLLSIEEAKQLERDTEGWVTGILLQPKLDRKNGWKSGSVTRLPGPRLYQYLEHQILHPLSDDFRKFLLRTSLFSEFNARLCEEVLGKTVYPEGKNWDKLLEAILRNNLFIVTFGNQEPSYRYTQFFKEFLLNIFEEELSDEKHLILVRLIEVLIHQEKYQEAFHYLSVLQDAEVTVKLIRQFSPQMMREGHYLTLLHLLEQIPAFILDSNPDLLSLKGIAVLTGRKGEQAIPLLDRAIKAFRAGSDQPGLTAALVRRAIAHQHMGNLQAALRDAEEALPILNDSPENLVSRARILRTKGICFHDLGQPDEALVLLTESLEISRMLKDEGQVTATLLDLGMVYRGKGEMRLASEIYLQAMDYLRRLQDMTRQANVLNNLGRFQLFEGDYENACLHFNQAMECARIISYSRMEAFVYSSFGEICNHLDANKAASRAYSLSRQIAERFRYRSLLFRLDLAEAGLARKQKKLTQARQFLLQAETHMESHSSVYESGLFYLESGMVELWENHLDRALEEFTRSFEEFQAAHRKLDAARAQFLIAYALFRIGQVERSLFILEQSMQLAGDLEVHHEFVLTGRDALDLIDFAIQQLPSKHYSSFRKKIKDFTDRKPALLRRVREIASAFTDLPASIEIKVFGEPEVKIQSSEIKAAEWPSLLQLELFLYIVLHPEGVTRGELEEVFSFNDDKQFTNTIYRLKKVVGNEVICLERNRYFFNRRLDYTCDVERFERLAEMAAAASSIEDKLEQFRHIAALYRGPLFQGVQRSWFIHQREKYSKVYDFAVLSIAQYHYDREEYALTLDYCERILTKNDCQEDAYRLAMRSSARSGNRADVEKLFRRCVHALWDRYQAEPSMQTKHVYQEAIRSESSLI